MQGKQRLKGESILESTFVTVPAYNESTVIADVVRALRQLPVTVVVIDDGSSDGTAAAAMSSGAVVVSHPLNRGQGAAIQTGLEYCLGRGAKVIATFDADGQHSVLDVARLVEPIALDRVDVVLGSRFLGSARGIPFTRKALLKIGVYFTRVFSNASITDVHNGLRAFSATAASEIKLTQDRMAHASQIIDQIVAAGLRFEEIPVEIRYTEYSKRKGQRATDAIRVAFEYLVGRVAR